MENLNKVVNDPEVIQKLIAQKFDDDSLPFLNESHLTKMGIELGIQAKILNYTEKLKKTTCVDEPSASSPLPSTSKQYLSSPSTPSKQHLPTKFEPNEIKRVLENNPRFRNIYYGKLEEDLTLARNELANMVGIICDHYFYTSVMAGDYPTTAEKRNLALTLIQIYPMLCSSNPDQPESELFKTVGGKNKGLIEQHICTLRGKVPKVNRLFRRKSVPVFVPVSDELIQKSGIIAKYPASPEYQPFISKGMAELHELHQFLINTHETPTKIISMLPQLLHFQGQMILESFDRIQNNRNPSVPTHTVLAQALLLPKSNMFSEIRDAYIRACLILMREMPVRGVLKRQFESKTDLTGMEVHAAPLIRWVELDDFADHIHSTHDMHIICEKSSKEGTYFVYITDDLVIDIGPSSCRAIEVLMKSFPVFGQKVPLFLSRLHEFFSIVCYGVQTDPTVQCVAKCVHKFKLCNTTETS